MPRNLPFPLFFKEGKIMEPGEQLRISPFLQRGIKGIFSSE
jgi:hypothetical protein